jgi:hypothetical protein
MLIQKQNTLIDNDIAINVEKYKFDLSKSYTQEVVFSTKGKTLGTYGSFVVLTGKPKARKTTFLHGIICAGILNDSIFNLQISLKENKNKVVLIDTEQSEFDLFMSINRLSNMTKYQPKDLPNFLLYSARMLDADGIKELIKTILQQNPNVGILCLDGALDLVNDINDVKESKMAIQFIKQICDEFKILFITVIHQNKGTNFSLGHLGSFASRFCQSELSIEKNDDNTSTLSATYLRSTDDIEPITIKFDEQNKRYDIVGSMNELETDHNVYLNKIFKDNYQYTYASFVNACVYVYGKSKYFTEKKLIPYLYDNQHIKKVDKFIQKCLV